MGIHALNYGDVRPKQWGRTLTTMGIHFLNNEGELQLLPNKDTVWKAWKSVGHASLSACMDGKSRLAPWSSRAESGMGPVLTAMVNTPDATPACTPSGAFSMMMELLGERRRVAFAGSDSVSGWKC